MDNINIDDIKILKRFRKDNGDIASFADNIREIGLLHPIVINQANELVCGHRRILAFRALQRRQIPCTKVNLESLAKCEFSENAYRKDFSISEMVEIKHALDPEIKREAQSRMKAGKPTSKMVKGRSTEIIAKALGIGHTSLEKAEKLVDAVERQPERFKELLEKVNSGKISLDRAYKDILQTLETEADKNNRGISRTKAPTKVEEKKEILLSTMNQEKQETAKELPTSAPKEIGKTSASSTKDKQISIHSLQNKIKILEREKKHVSEELSEKSRELDDLFEEMKRIRYNDFNNAESLLTDGELLKRINALEKQRDHLLAKNRFEAYLELNEQIVPVIILIDRLEETAKVTVDTTKMQKRSLA